MAEGSGGFFEVIRRIAGASSNKEEIPDQQSDNGISKKPEIKIPRRSTGSKKMSITDSMQQAGIKVDNSNRPEKQDDQAQNAAIENTK